MRVNISNFEGLDKRWLSETPEMEGSIRLTSANNVELKIGGGIKNRPQLKKHATVDSSSFGLYALGGVLRSAIAQTASAVPRAPLGFEYDVFCDNDTGVDGVVNGTAVELANVTGWRGRPYLVIGRRTNSSLPNSVKYEHHYIQYDTVPLVGKLTIVGPATDTDTIVITGPIPSHIKAGATVYFTNIADGSPYVIESIVGQTITLTTATELSGTQVLVVHPNINTKVSTPFAPGRALVLASEKIYADDIDSNNVWFSSTINGPTDWSNPGDAGYDGTSTHVSGNQGIKGLGVFNGRLVVFYSKDLQVWEIGVDPVSHRLVGSVGGAGTDSPRSIANVMGDTFYFSQGAVRSVQSVITTGQLKEDDVGAAIQELTKTIDVTTQNVLCNWSPARQQFMMFVGTTVYVMTFSPNSKTSGFSQWTIPWEVSDVAELDGSLYVRRAGTGEIYKFDDDYVGESGYSWSCRFSYLDAGTFNIKKWQGMYAHQSGKAVWSLITEPRKESATAIPIGTIDGSMDNLGVVFIGSCAHRIALQASGTTSWEMEGFSIDCEVGNPV